MATYLLLFSGGRMPEGEAEAKQVMGAWESWMGKYHDNIPDPGNPFSPSVKSIRTDGTVTDRPTGGPHSGYTIVKADSLDHAVDIAKECPVRLGGAIITVYETFDVMAAVSAGSQN